MEAGIVPASGNDVEVLKKEKLQLKDKLYGIPGPPTDTPERFRARAGHDACPALLSPDSLAPTPATPRKRGRFTWAASRAPAATRPLSPISKPH